MGRPVLLNVKFEDVSVCFRKRGCVVEGERQAPATTIPPDTERIGQLERMKLNEDKGVHGGGNVNVVS